MNAMRMCNNGRSLPVIRADSVAVPRQLSKPADVPMQTKDEDVHCVIATTDAAMATAVPSSDDWPLPPGWRWARLDTVCMQDRQTIVPGSDLYTTRPYLSLEHVESNTGRILREPAEVIADEGQSTTFAFDSRHILYGKLCPYLNKVALPDFAGRCTTELIPLLPQGTDREFLAWILRRQETVETAMHEKTGSRMPRTDMNDLFDMAIPIPPLEPVMKMLLANLNGALLTGRWHA